LLTGILPSTYFHERSSPHPFWPPCWLGYYLQIIPLW
jgi:hypothetical protein